MDCNVLRCSNPARSFFNVGTPESGRFDVGVCEEHRSQIEQGARWIYQPAEKIPGGRVLMGRDLPPRVVEVNVTSGLLGPEGMTRLFTLMVENHDSSRREVDFELPPGIAEGVWRVLNRGRGRAEPGSPPGE
jgi:hypothetical protein